MAGTGTAGYGGDGGPAVQARLNRPTRICVDDRGCLYIADTGNHRIRKVDTGGIITTVAGTGQSGFGGDGGPAVLAWFQAPLDVAVTGDGSLYIADTGNYRIRRVGPDGMISTVAGDGTESLSHSWGYSGVRAGDGWLATEAEVFRPSGVVSDGNGGFYILAIGAVRHVDSAGLITGLWAAPIGWVALHGAEQQATSGHLCRSPRGALFLADTDRSMVRRGDPETGEIVPVAGGLSTGEIKDGGPALASGLGLPAAVACDRDGILYIADAGHQRIRRVTPAGIITTVAGTGIRGYSGDGGSALGAAFNDPMGVAVAGDELYIADTQNNRIRQVVALPAATVADTAAVAADPDLVTLDFDPAEGNQGRAVAAYGHAGWTVDLELHARDLPALTGWRVSLVADPEQLRIVRAYKQYPYSIYTLPLTRRENGEIELSAEPSYDTGPLAILTCQILPGFTGRADLTVTRVEFNPSLGYPLISRASSLATVTGSPGNADLPVVSLDFDLAPGDQSHRSAVVDPWSRQRAVEIRLNDAPPVDSCSITLTYDHALIRCVPDSLKTGGFMSGSPPFLPLVHQPSGAVRIDGLRAGTPVAAAGSAVLGELTLEAREDRPWSSPLSVTEATLRLPGGVTYRLAEVCTAAVSHRPVQPALALDFDPAPGDQRQTTTSARAGSERQVQLLLGSVPGVARWRATLAYDPTRLSFAPGSFGTGGLPAGPDGRETDLPGLLTVGGQTGDVHADSAAELGCVTFRVLPDSTGSVWLRVTSLVLYNARGDSLVRTPLAGAVLLVPAEPRIYLVRAAGDGLGSSLVTGVNPGQIYLLELHARDLPEIRRWMATLAYDPVQLRVLPGEFRPGGFIPGLVPVADAGDGTAYLGGAAPEGMPGQAGSGVLGIIPIEVLAGFSGQATVAVTQTSIHLSDGTTLNERLPTAVSFLGQEPDRDTAVASSRSTEPGRTLLRPVWPNPGNGGFTVAYELAEPAVVELEIYHLSGQRLCSLVSGSQSPGRYAAVWDGTDAVGRRAGTGLYLVRLQAGAYSQVQKLLLVR